jgi:5-methylcytosine-specific restriction endonuclease McrA
MITHLNTIDINSVRYKAVNAHHSCGRKARRQLDILKRDNFKCVTCNRTKNLTIAHIKPVGKARNISTYKLDNCRILCEECHIKIDHTVIERVNYIYH